MGFHVSALLYAAYLFAVQRISREPELSVFQRNKKKKKRKMIN